MNIETLEAFGTAEAFVATSSYDDIWRRISQEAVGKYKLSYLRDVYNQMVKYDKMDEDFLGMLLAHCPVSGSLDDEFTDKFLELVSQCIPYRDFNFSECSQLKTADELRIYLGSLKCNTGYTEFLGVKQTYSLSVEETELLLTLTNFDENIFLRYLEQEIAPSDALLMFQIRNYSTHFNFIDSLIGKVPVCVISALCIYKGAGIDVSNFNSLEVLFYNHKFWLERLGLHVDCVIGLNDTLTTKELEILKQIWIYLTGDNYVVTNEAYALEEYLIDLVCAQTDRDIPSIDLKRETYSRDFQYVLYVGKNVISFYEDTVPYIYNQITGFLNSMSPYMFSDIFFDCSSKYALGVHMKQNKREQILPNESLYTKVTDEMPILDGIKIEQFNALVNTMYQIGVEINYFEWGTLLSLALLKMKGHPYLEWYSKFQNNYLILNSIFKTIVLTSMFNDKTFSILLDQPGLYNTIFLLKDCMQYNTPFNNAVFLMAVKKMGWLLRADDLIPQLPDTLKVRDINGAGFEVSFKELLLNVEQFVHPELQNKFCKVSVTDEFVTLQF